MFVEGKNSLFILSKHHNSYKFHLIIDFMECLDISNQPIKPGFYLETFYKGDDEFRNRIIWVTSFRCLKSLYSVTNQSTPVQLNPNYSRWLKPVEAEIPSLEEKLGITQMLSDITTPIKEYLQNRFQDPNDPLFRAKTS